MKQTMEIIECGAIVVPKLMKIDGMITCVSVRFGKVSYEVAYFLDGKYEAVWLNEMEFDIKSGVRINLGFR